MLITDQDPLLEVLCVNKCMCMRILPLSQFPTDDNNEKKEREEKEGEERKRGERKQGKLCFSHTTIASPFSFLSPFATIASPFSFLSPFEGQRKEKGEAIVVWEKDTGWYGCVSMPA